jgi:hypothetical protein
MITAKIDVTKINKQYIFDGKKGKYIDLVLFENKDGTDRFENDGMVVQGLPKEARDRGEKGPILGNFKNVKQQSRQQQQTTKATPTSQSDPDDVPF